MFKNGWESNQENIIIGNEVYDLDQMQFGQLLVHFLIPQLCGLLFMSGYPDWIILVILDPCWPLPMLASFYADK